MPGTGSSCSTHRLLCVSSSLPIVPLQPLSLPAIPLLLQPSSKPSFLLQCFLYFGDAGKSFCTCLASPLLPSHIPNHSSFTLESGRSRPFFLLTSRPASMLWDLRVHFLTSPTQYSCSSIQSLPVSARESLACHCIYCFRT